MLAPPNITVSLFLLPGIGFATEEQTRTARTAIEMLEKNILDLAFGSWHCSNNDVLRRSKKRRCDHSKDF